MATRVQIECPNCAAVFTLNSREPLGKQVPCPKCQTPFVATEKPREVQFEDSSPELEIVPETEPRRHQASVRPQRRRVRRQSVDDYDDYDDFEETPRSKSVRKKKAPTGMGWKLPLIIGGSVLGVVIVGLVIWLAVGKVFSDKIDYAWLPDDAYQITVARYSQLWKSEIVQDALTGQNKDDIRKMKADWGIEPKDIESVTTASAAGDRIVVLRSHIDLDQDRILGRAGKHEKAEYGGETYYRVGFGRYLQSAIYFPDARTAISGNERSVKRAIDRGPKSEPREDLKFIDGSHHILTIFIRQGETRSNHFSALPTDRIKARATGVNLTSSMETVWQVKFDSAADAEEYEERVKDLAGRNAGPFGSFARSAVDHSIKRNGDVITTRATVKTRGIFRGQLRATHTFGVPSIASVAKNPERLFGYTWFAQMQRYAKQRRYVSVDLRRFEGNGDPGAAARNAVSDMPGLDQSRLKIDARRIEMYFDYQTSVNRNEIQRRLRAAGFRNAYIRSMGTRVVQ